MSFGDSSLLNVVMFPSSLHLLMYKLEKQLEFRFLMAVRTCGVEGVGVCCLLQRVSGRQVLQVGARRGPWKQPQGRQSW